MKALIIEDEKAAVRNLVVLLKEIRPELEVIAILDSIAATIEWFGLNPMPDLIFMDIHLADGSAFGIFDHVDIMCPIVFTTAYDEYALRAFKVNSVDYLLKPIAKTDIEKAFQKLRRMCAFDSVPFQNEDVLRLVRSLKKQESYKTHFLIPVKGDKLMPISVDMIMLFYIKDCRVKAVLADRSEYVFPQTLDEISDCVNPSLFFRINRQYLISRESVKDIDLWFNNRLSVNLRFGSDDEKVLVSKARVQEFKIWFSSSL